MSSTIRKFQLDSTPQLDAFARLRVSSPYTIFDSKLLSDKGSLYYDEVLNGSATSVHSQTDAAVSMSVSSSGDYAIRQTYMRFNYQPGKSQEVLFTGVLGSPTINTEAKIGYFNTSTTAPYTANEDGLYFGCDGTGVYVAQAKSGVTTKVYQESWNKDRVDGSGGITNPSGVTANWAGREVFSVDFEWLGVGDARFYIFVNDMPILLHEFENANDGDSSGAYMSSPNHSIRYELRSTGGSKTIKQVCASVISEGGVEPSGVSRSFNTGITAQNVGTTKEAMIGFRLKDTHLNATVVTEFLSLIATGNEDTLWELQMNPTYANTESFVSAGSSSPVEYMIGDGANEVTVDGIVLASGYLSDNTNQLGQLANTIVNPGVSIDGDRDEVWLCCACQTGSGNYLAAMNLRELNIG